MIIPHFAEKKKDFFHKIYKVSRKRTPPLFGAAVLPDKFCLCLFAVVDEQLFGVFLYGKAGRIKRNFDVPLSVDTYFSKCADAALELGADMINDVWGLTHDADMAKVIAAHGASVCIMHNAGKAIEGDVFSPVISFLKSSAELAEKSGIPSDRICVDGGIGFAKSREQNFMLLEGYERLKEVGYPLLLGTSRKSLFGGRVEDRLPATLQSTRLAARKGVLFVRVHDVAENVQAIREVYGD